MKHSPNRSASPGGGFGDGLRWVLRAVLLLLVLTLVAGVGLVIGEGSREPQLTESEQALADRAAAADSLAAAARSLAETSGPSDSETYSEFVRLFELHASALQPHAAVPPDPSSTAPGSGSTPTAVPSSEPAPVTAASLLGAMRASYTAAFDAAATAEAGPARLLASVATSQWLHAQVLARALDVEPPPQPVEAPAHDGVAGPCAVDATAEADPGLKGTRTAVLAELQAAYAYEVVAARAPEPDPYLPGVARHESAAAVGSSILAEHCVAQPVPAAAYALDEDFHTEPDAALRNLERALIRTYADLVGVSEAGPVRDWAIDRLTVAARQAFSAEGGLAELEAFPGIDPLHYPEVPGSSE